MDKTNESFDRQTLQMSDCVDVVYMKTSKEKSFAIERPDNIPVKKWLYSLIRIGAKYHQGSLFFVPRKPSKNAESIAFEIDCYKGHGKVHLKTKYGVSKGFLSSPSGETSEQEAERQRREDKSIHLNAWRVDGKTRLKNKEFSHMRTGEEISISDMLEILNKMYETGSPSQAIKDTILSEKFSLISALNSKFDAFHDNYCERRYKSGKVREGRARIIDNSLYINRKILKDPIAKTIIKEFKEIEKIKRRLDVIIFLEDE